MIVGPCRRASERQVPLLPAFDPFRPYCQINRKWQQGFLPAAISLPMIPLCLETVYKLDTITVLPLFAAPLLSLSSLPCTADGIPAA